MEFILLLKCILLLAPGSLGALVFVFYVFFISGGFDEVSLYIHADPHKVDLLAEST